MWHARREGIKNLRGPVLLFQANIRSAMLTPRHPFRTAIAAFALSSTNSGDAQNFDPGLSNVTCSDISQYLAINTTNTVNMTAVNVRFLGSEPEIAVYEDTRHTWTITNWVQPAYCQQTQFNSCPGNETEPVVWIDPGDSYMERLDSILGYCHNYIPWKNSTTGQVALSREALERAEDDNGDCKAMLGEECVKALEHTYASNSRLSTTEGNQCSISHDIPEECEGVLRVRPRDWRTYFTLSILFFLLLPFDTLGTQGRDTSVKRQLLTKTPHHSGTSDEWYLCGATLVMDRHL